MYSLQGTRTEDVSPKRSQEILNTRNNFPGQRKLRMDWAQYLASEMSGDAFTKGHIVFAENGTEDSAVLINGQHQLQACVIANRPFRATIDTYHVENDDDKWHLFGKFDVQKTRSEAVIMKAAKGMFKSELLRGVSLRTLSACSTALQFLGGGVIPRLGGYGAVKILSKTDKVDLVQKYESDVLFVDQMFIASGREKNAMKVMEATCIIATSRKNKAKAKDFWPRVMGGMDLEKNSPEWRLHRELSSGGLTKRSGMSGGGRLLLQWNLCITWWNSYITGKNRDSVKLASMKGPVEVCG